MFKEAPQGYRLPTDPIEKFEAEPASFGGGFILRLTIRGKVESLVFSDQIGLTQYLLALSNAVALARPVQAAPEAPVPVIETATKPRQGRPRLSDEEKAANKARKLSEKAPKAASKKNGKAPDLEVIADPEHAAPAIATA